ncbi:MULTISPECIES: MFS transporter [Luteimonas]|uniref:MFS transporter n=1 Tax=Luteimonas TaxID=83614 RepID=UPI000C7DB53E|nr:MULTISPECIES: MFS transporter [Luteimonas]
MSSPALPPRVTGALYAAAGALFVIGAVASDRLAFAAVGLAFIGLGVRLLVRSRSP